MRGRWRKAVGTGLLALLSPVVFLGMLELTARALGVRPLAEDEHYRLRDRARTCRWDPAHTEKRCEAGGWSERGDGRMTVFVVGGSSVVGHLIEKQQNIPHFVQQRLDAVRPGGYVVRNMARPCKDSHYVLRCAERAIEARPDVLVVYSGHNDFAGLLHRYPEIQIWMARSGWWLVRIERAFARTRLWNLLVPEARRAPPAPLEDRSASLTPEQLARANRIILDAYSENIREIARLARERGTAVVLVTVVSNLYEWPVRRAQWDELLEGSGDDANAWRSHYTSGIERFRASRFPEALEAFERAREALPGSRAPAMLNRRIRELAAEQDAVHLVDFERELERVGVREGIGCNFFGTDAYCDGVHPNPRTNRLIGRAVGDEVLSLTKGERGR